MKLLLQSLSFLGAFAGLSETEDGTLTLKTVNHAYEVKNGFNHFLLWQDEKKKSLSITAERALEKSTDVLPHSGIAAKGFKLKTKN